MLTLPVELTNLSVGFAPLFSKRVGERAKVLRVGALRASGKRTVSAALRVRGLSNEAHFHNYHRGLNRAVWSALAASRILLGLRVRALAPGGVLVVGLEDTLERRRGEKLTARGIYRDPVRSSRSQVVKASGLRWLCCALLAKIAWAQRSWALPFLTALCPSERFYQKRGRRQQKLTDRAGQLIHVVRRWLPGREVVFVAESSFAVLTLLNRVSDLPQGSLSTRLRLAAAWYDPTPPRPPRQNGRPRLKGTRRPTLHQRLDKPHLPWTPLTRQHWDGEGERRVEVCTDTAVWSHSGMAPVPIRWVLSRDPQGEFAPQAVLSTTLTHTPQQLREWFMSRWTLEVTFEEARAPLGLETQRQWNDLASARTTPMLLGLYSLVTLLASQWNNTGAKVVRTAAWYAKEQPTFSDAIAVVRRHLWSQCYFSTSVANEDVIKIPRSLFDRLTDAVCYAA